MTISLITPTSDRPEAWPILERYIARQTVQPDEWLVVDDGEEPAPLAMGQDHLRRPRTHEAQRSLAMNIMAGLPKLTGDIIIIAEDDDWYAPDHVATCIHRLERTGALATGCGYQHYYNVYHRHWIRLKNKGSSLCSTALVKEAVPRLLRAARDAFDANRKGVDQLFWTRLGLMGDVHGRMTCCGIKGLPGRPGIGMGHQPPDHRWTADPDLVKLREWIGSDAETYAKYSHLSDGLSNFPVKYPKNA